MRRECVRHVRRRGVSYGCQRPQSSSRVESCLPERGQSAGNIGGDVGKRW